MTPIEKERYSRQILFRGIGEAGQERLLASRVAIVGCGALGSFQAGALARAGAGNLVIIDRDYVEFSNLQRQWLFEEADAAESLPKAVAATRRLAKINSGIKATPVVADLSPSNIEELLADADLVLDGTDNFETRFLINDFCVSREIPWVYGAAVGSYGIVMPVLPGCAACLKCVYPKAPGGLQPTCETVGVLNTITSLSASVQVSEAIKILCGQTGAAAHRITTVDVWTSLVRQIELPARDPDCEACGARHFVHLEGVRRTPISLCGRNAVQIHERANALDLSALEQRLSPLGEVRFNEFALRFFISPYEMTIFPDGRAIIKGTTDIGVARSLYAKYVGN
jgi:molybdopterin/thiamine biosynthesis adenylyltransferase